MTKREIREINAVIRECLIDDEELLTLWKTLNYTWYQKKDSEWKKEWKEFLRKECYNYWTDFDTYLDKKYLDISYMIVGNKIINVDDLWIMIRDDLKDDMRTMIENCKKFIKSI